MQCDPVLDRATQRTLKKFLGQLHTLRMALVAPRSNHRGGARRRKNLRMERRSIDSHVPQRDAADTSRRAERIDETCGTASIVGWVLTAGFDAAFGKNPAHQFMRCVVRRRLLFRSEYLASQCPQSVSQRCAGHHHQSGKRSSQFQNKKNRARCGKGKQGKASEERHVKRRKQAVAREYDHEP